MITDDMRRRMESVLRIDYESCLGQATLPLTPTQLLELADDVFAYEWIDAYRMQCDRPTSVLSITLDGYIFLWDESYERVVAVYGTQKNGIEKRRRDKSRIAYYYRNFIQRYQKDTATDTGHFIAHSFGGGLDMNLFPQKRDINQGRSAEGKLYRRMENYVLMHPGTFVFSRPVYFDDTWRPVFLEYGVGRTDTALWVNIFDNI